MALSDGKILDAQAGAETFGSALLAALAGVNSVSGPGMLDFLLVFSLPKLVFDDEMCGQALRFVREVRPVDDLPVGALIDHLMTDQHLIMADHTTAHWPDELYLPSSIVDRDNREAWLRQGGKDTFERAKDEVERRLASYVQPPTDPRLDDELKKIILSGPDRPDRAAVHSAAARAVRRPSGRPGPAAQRPPPAPPGGNCRMTAPLATPATTESSTLYFGPWYRRSPFFEKTLEAGCSAYDIYNHMYLPGYYGDPLEEYWALLNDVTVWDVSVERIVEITGPDASAFTNTLTCRDLTKCAVGQGKYVLITAEDGGIVNDPVLLRVEENRWWLALADSDAGLWARGVAINSGLDVTVREPEVYPVQVQGPKSKDVMRTLFGDAVDGIKYYWTLTTELDGIPVVISRTGWTGEVGYEIYLRDPSRGGDLWDRIMEAGRPHDIRPIAPCEARRIEAGIFNYGSDMTIENNPFEVIGPGAPGRAAGRRLHRQGGARADPRTRRVTASSSGSRSRATRCRSRSPRSWPALPRRRDGRHGHRPDLVAAARARTSATSGSRSGCRSPARRSRSRRPTAGSGRRPTAAIPFIDPRKDTPKS